ncbi:MAG: epoxide hydrolase family protein [Acidimicrobiales bacterium]
MVTRKSSATESAVIQPQRISVSDEQLADLHQRLLATRWPDTQCLPVFRQRGIVHHWLHHYDWRARESLLNSFGWFNTVIDDTAVDFLHAPSSRPDALPILLVHGWPGSVLEFRSVIPALSERFHVVIPSLSGWDLPRMASAWAEVMGRLGYDRWLAHGGGWGARLAAHLGLLRPEGLEAVHLATSDDPMSEAPAAAWAVALTDSPAGLAAWALKAYAPWTQSDVGLDEVLDSVMMLWLANSWAPREVDTSGELTVPVGCSQFAPGTRRPDEIWPGLTCHDLFYRNEVAPAARFPALQQPDVLVAELQRCFAARTWWHG